MSTDARLDAEIPSVLRETRTIAAVGASPNPVRPSFYVLRYLLGKGYKVIPVNPVAAGGRLLGEKVWASLGEIPQQHDPIDMVEVFRAPEAATAVVEEAIRELGGRGLRTVWMQLGVVNETAARLAREAGLRVVMNRCPKIEYARHFGELRWGGFNTGILSSRLD